MTIRKRVMPYGLAMLFVMVMYASAQPKAEAVTLYFTLRIDNTINGINYDRNDIIKFDTVSHASSLFFDGDTIFKKQVNEVEIDAFDILSNGDILLSTARNASIGSLSFENEDVVRVNPTTHAATLFFDGSTAFKHVTNLEAIDLLPNGHLVFAADTGEMLKNGLKFTSRDLVEYDPLTGNSSLFFKGDDHFKGEKGQITGLDVLDDGRLVFIIGDAGRAANLGGHKVGRRDIFIYDPVHKTFDGELVNGDDIFQRTSHQHDQGFGGVDLPPPSHPVVPEPMTSSLFGVGLLGLVSSWCRRRDVCSTQIS